MRHDAFESFLFAVSLPCLFNPPGWKCRRAQEGQQSWFLHFAFHVPFSFPQMMAKHWRFEGWEKDKSADSQIRLWYYHIISFPELRRRWRWVWRRLWRWPCDDASMKERLFQCWADPKLQVSKMISWRSDLLQEKVSRRWGEYTTKEKADSQGRYAISIENRLMFRTPRDLKSAVWSLSVSSLSKTSQVSPKPEKPGLWNNPRTEISTLQLWVSIHRGVTVLVDLGLLLNEVRARQLYST